MTDNTNQILAQAAGTGQKCKIRRDGAQILKAAHRATDGTMSLRTFARTLADAGDKAARAWLRHKGMKPVTVKRPKRIKKPSDEASKMSGRSKMVRFPIYMAPAKTAIA